MNRYIISFNEIDSSKSISVGGKGANLGALSRIKEIQVPDGFCITTEAYRILTAHHSKLKRLVNELTGVKGEEREKVSKISAVIRTTIENIPIPDDMSDEIVSYLRKLGEDEAYAVRSSATAEDLPTASFAGQQDTYLNIIGKEAILTHIRKCWASLFTDRAVTYRIQNNFDHSQVYLAVVIQRMVFPDAAGILFTADPVTSNRKMLSIDAGFGLGEAMVSGLVSPDCYKVKEDQIIHKMIATKKVAIYGIRKGGTETVQLNAEKQKAQVLTDQQILELARVGRQIETYFHSPQDIEWCLVDDIFYIVQSRPITTLYPVPARPVHSGGPDAGGSDNHVYISVGHQQMMTDAIKPLGLSFYLLTTRAPMLKAGGRLFVDVTTILSVPARRKMFLDSLAESEPLTKDALMTIVERKFIKSLPAENQTPPPVKDDKAVSPFSAQISIENDPAIVAALIKNNEASIATLKQNIQEISGSDLFEFIRQDIQELKKILFEPPSRDVFMSAMNASSWINEKMNLWLGEKNAADTLSQSVPNNITSEMGLALLDVADAIRPYPQVIEYLQHVNDDNFLEQLDKFEGGQQVESAITAFLTKYGMRCVGEIDISRTRWSEKPAILIPMILSNIKNVEPNTSQRKFELGRQEAMKKELALLDRLKQLPDGEEKAKETKHMIDLVRNFIGYREYPKYSMISRYFIYKQALLKEAERLLKAGIINDKEDIFYLSFEELQEVVTTKKLDQQVIGRRKEEYKLYEKLSPPRVITSDGEIITGAYKREGLPTGAIPGLPVSTGIIEGRARVLLSIEDADLEDGDILITLFTDPSWTPLFVSIKGLVTEVGGLMTHGAVIAREYGLPAVVGVEHATTLIKDGQRIRVNGTDGYLEIL